MTFSHHPRCLGVTGPQPTRPYGLKEVSHADGLTVQAWSDGEARFLEPRRTEADRRIAGEAKSFTGNSREGIQTAIGVCVMDNGKRVISARHIGKT